MVCLTIIAPDCRCRLSLSLTGPLMRIGYATVSTTEQNPDLQRDALKPAHVGWVEVTDAREKCGLTTLNFAHHTTGGSRRGSRHSSIAAGRQHQMHFRGRATRRPSGTTMHL